MKTIFFILFYFISLSSLFAQGKPELIKIEFDGNESFSEQVLEKIIISRESPYWFFQLLDRIGLGEKPVFLDLQKIPKDKEAIKKFYFDNGFFNVQVRDSLFPSRMELDERAELYFKIDEGKSYFLESFAIPGLQDIDEYVYNEIILPQTQLRKNQRYTKVFIEERIGSILTLLRDNGYMLVSDGKPIVTIDSIKNSVDVEVSFIPGFRYKVSNVNVEKTGPGKDLVTDELLKRIVGVKPSDNYSSFENRRGQIRLYRTNLFRSVVVNGVVADTFNNFVPISISAEVGLLNELVPQLILNNENNALNFGFAVGYQRKNFFGDARKFSLSVAAASQDLTDFIGNFSINDTSIFGYSDTRLSLEQPFLFGEPIITKFETYLTLQKRLSEFNANIFGNKISFNFELPRITFFSSFLLYLNIERSEYVYQDPYLIEGLTVFYQNSGFLPDEASQIATDLVETKVIPSTSSSTNSVIGVDLKANKTNNFMFPSKGFTLSFLFEEGNSVVYFANQLLENNLNIPLFVKLQLNAATYLSWFGSDVSAIGFKFRTGNIFTYSGNQSDIPANLRFYSGGSNSVRGWRTRELVPPLNFDNIAVDDLNSVLRGLAPGGFFIFEGSLESRNRLINKIGTAVFIDFGNTWNDLNDFKFSDIAVAAGFGFRYYSEFAPFRLDFGFKVFDPESDVSIFKRQLFSDILEFHIGIGEAF